MEKLKYPLLGGFDFSIVSLLFWEVAMATIYSYTLQGLFGMVAKCLLRGTPTRSSGSINRIPRKCTLTPDFK